MAQVANEPILETELIQAAYFEAQNANLDIFRDEAKLDSMKRVVLKNLIDFRVLLAAAKADTNIRVNENEIITKANADYQKLLSQAGTEERLAEKFRSSTKKIKKDLEENARKNTYVQKYVEKKLENVRVSKAEVTKFWEENRDKFNKLPATVRLANILLTIQPNEVAKRQALQKADSIKNLLDKGKDFAELAKQYSTDNSAKYGGDLGEVERGTFLPEFESVVYKLSEGEISKPVETKYGFHIIKLHYRRGNKFHVSHILIGLTPTTEDTLATKSKADSLYQRIKAGESFEQIAKGVSEDAETAKRGGDMGWIELEKLPDFATPIKNLKDGECTAPFLFAGSYHILKRVQTNPERYPNLQEDWDKIEQLAQSKARAMAYENLVESAKKKVYIQLMQE
ncbi:MAG: peptidylprolyl isomerase [bacterium]|nr:peptidylprolyl isomerase [bacterium]